MLPHLDAAYTLAQYLLRDPHLAQDVVQDSCLRALRHFAGFRGENARAWLLSIVRHGCATARTRGRRDRTFEEFDERRHTDTSGMSPPELHLIRADTADRFHRALDALPVPFREVLILREIEELSYEEIALTVGAPVGTVMSRLSRARRRMQELLRPEERDVG